MIDDYCRRHERKSHRCGERDVREGYGEACAGEILELERIHEADDGDDGKLCGERETRLCVRYLSLMMITVWGQVVLERWRWAGV